MINPAEDLICRIFEQAIDDYQFLKDKKIEEKKDRDSEFSIKELESFFNSQWSCDLLKMIGCQIKGKDVLRGIQVQCA